MVRGRDHPADDDHDVRPVERRELRAQLGHQREVPRGERGDADDVHVRLDGLPGHLGRGLEQRADVDVEARGRRTRWRSPSGRGRGRPGPSSRPGCAAGAPPAAANSSTSSRARSMAGFDPASSEYTPEMMRIWPEWRPKTFSSASEISPTVAFARAAATDSASRFCSSVAGRALRDQRRRRRSAPGNAASTLAVVALLAQPAQLLQLLAAHPGVVDLAGPRSPRRTRRRTCSRRSPAGARSRCGPGCAPRPPRRAASGCRRRSPGPSRRPSRPPRCAPTRAGRGRRSAARRSSCRPTGRSPSSCPTPAAAAAGCCGRSARRSRWAARAPRPGRWCAGSGCGPGWRPSPRRRCGSTLL